MNGLPDSPKMEVKGVIMVKGLWNETPGSPGLPFDVNWSQPFLGVCVGGRLSLNIYVYTCDFVRNWLWIIGAGKNRRHRLVHWVEKASLEKIRRLLEIYEQERHYKVLLTLKNLADVRRSLAPYSLSIIPCPLPSEIVDREHFVTTDLINLIASSVSLSGDPEAKTKHHGSRLYRWPLPTRIPALHNLDLIKAKKVSAR